MSAGRDNHFNLLRIALAAGVLLSHCFLMTQGSHNYSGEPWFVFTGGKRLLGVTCVLGFFVISGFLVSESFERAGSLRTYFAARALRIYPAAIVCALLSAFALGPLVTDQSLADYLFAPGLRKFLLHTTMFLKLSLYDLIPGTFPHNPIPGTVNGSLWTIPWELFCYLILVPVGLLLYRAPSRPRRIVGYGALLVLSVIGSRQYASHSVPSSHFAGLIVFWGFFSMGIMGRALLARLPGNGWITLAVLAMFLAIEHFERSAPALATASPFLFGYVLLSAATQLPRSWLVYNRLGDFSYGLYLYAWPVQQTIIFLFPGIGPWTLCAAALPAALALAVPSWHLLEKRALRLKVLFARPRPQPSAAVSVMTAG